VTFPTDLDRLSELYLTTVGRVTGQGHRIEIWFAQRGSTIYLLSGGAERSDWVRNLTRTPRVKVHAGRREFDGAARIVTDRIEDRLARDAIYEKYAVRYSGDLTRWRETALPIAVDLIATAPDPGEQ
jgi:deazaflavin-dependent oxidoreductase (nitroreductase family)